MEINSIFRGGRATTDQMFTLRLIMEKCYEYNITVHQLYVDFKAAYDCVERHPLYEAMHELGIPRKLISLVKMTLRETKSKVRTKGQISDVFSIHKGLRQGDSLSCTLFNLVLENIMRKIPTNKGGTIFNRTTQNLAFADDIAMLGTNVKYLKENFHLLEENAGNMGLRVSREKTKYMIGTRNKIRWRNLQDFEGFERVKSFKYLGGIITENNDVTTEIKARLAAGNRSYYKFISFLKSSLISRKLKTQVYTTIIKPVVLYGSETWTLTKKDEELLNLWERKILRKIYGAVKINGEWRIRTNAELKALYKKPSIATDIRARRLRWLGHVQRMEDYRIPKKVLHAKPEGSRSIGRPRLRWLDGVEEDLRQLGVRQWKRKAADRKRWRVEVVDKALAPHGL